MNNFDFLVWLEQSWLVLVACLGGITLVWNFIHKTLKEITSSFAKPVKDIEEKIDKMNVKMDDANKHREMVTRALLSMQRASLLKSSLDYIKKGFATMEEKQTMSEQFLSYSELGGNSFVQGFVDDVMNLPLDKQKKTRNKSIKE